MIIALDETLRCLSQKTCDTRSPPAIRLYVWALRTPVLFVESRSLYRGTYTIVTCRLICILSSPAVQKHEIVTNTGGVDLLVSLAYVAAAEGVLDEPLPRGMGLRVHRPEGSNVQVDNDNLCEFDSLSLQHVRGPL